MRSRSAVLVTAPADGKRGTIEILEVEVDEPRQDEILVRMVGSGLCHSDDHMLTGDLPAKMYPISMGHEGAGVVERVGPDTTGYAVGDHVVFSFMPVCGRCRWCATGQQNLCDRGAQTMSGARPDDPCSFRVHLLDGSDVGQMAGLGTFSEYACVSVNSAVKVDSNLPLDRLCLLGCGVGTGWGAAVNSAPVHTGDVVIVMGVGGIGINAVQGAAFAGANRVIAVDPVALKRNVALKLGATDACVDMDSALEIAKSVTNGQGADSVIVTVGVVNPDIVGGAFRATRKGGTIVVTAVGKLSEVGISVPLAELTLFQKRIQGSLFGATNPTFDIPLQTRLYRQGQLHLDELVTTTYRLDDLAQGYEDMRAGKNIRGVVVFD